MWVQRAQYARISLFARAGQAHSIRRQTGESAILSSLSNEQNWDLSLNWRHFAFFLGVPVAIATYESIGDRYWIETLGVPMSVAFHMGHAIIPWWISAACTKGAMELLRRWKPNLLILTLCGALMADVIAMPYVHWVSTQFLADRGLSSSEGFQFLRETAQAGVLWILITFAFDRFLGFRIYRYEGPTLTDVSFFETSPGTNKDKEGDGLKRGLPAPRFLERVQPHAQAENVLLLKAEEHYIRIFLDDREELVLYRFSDAVAELDTGLGCQVHRSYWVSFRSIERIETGDRKITLHLTLGLQVPVSARYQEIVRQRTKDLKLQPAETTVL